MKLTDYIADYLASLGIRKVFLITGGACAHIVDSLGQRPGIEYVSMQHEQAAAMAADAYARMTGKPGVAVATSGPGATNLITGVCCSYFDSIPTIMITGQVNLWETKGDRKIRQAGFQETDIIDIVRPITKYAVMVKDASRIRYELEKAVYIAMSGRPGPVWIDVPMNVQHAEIDPSKLEWFDPIDLKEEVLTVASDTIDRVVELIQRAERPVVIAGFGIALGRAQQEFLAFVHQLQIPVVSTWSGIDLLPYDHPLYVGQFGVYGSRGANFTVQNADLLISLGSRLDTRQTGGQPKTFARGATKVVIDIDKAELFKQWVVADVPIHADVKDFLIMMNSRHVSTNPQVKQSWNNRCRVWKERYSIVLPEYERQQGSVNAYVFMRSLSDRMKEGDVVVTDQGGNLTWTIQGFRVKKDQKLFSAFGNSPMGYALPAAIGASFALPNKGIVCIDGDGGFQLNIQELQTIVHNRLPIKIFILNNHSYGIIKQFQEVYFDGRYEATMKEKGYSSPDFIKVAEAYGIATTTINSHSELVKTIDHVLQFPGPILCDVLLDEAQKLIPKLVAVKSADGQRYISKPIEDMIPLLPREEFYQNMIVPPLEEEGQKKSTEIN